MHRSGIAGTQRFHHALHRPPCVHDILHDDDRASRQVLIDAQHLLYFTRRGRALVRRQFHKRNFTRNRDFTHQIGCKNKRTVKNTQQQRVLPFHIMTDTRCQNFHPLLDFFFRYGDTEGFVLDFNCIHRVIF